MSSEAYRCIVANLACEAEWAAERARGLSAGAGRGDQALKSGALRAISALGTLLRVFAEPGDYLWTPVPVEPARLPEVAGLATPRLVSGPLNEYQPARVLAWAETLSVARLRGGASELCADAGLGDRWLDGVWRMPVPDPVLQPRLNDRQFYTDLRELLGEPFQGAAWIRGVADLSAHIESLVTSGAPPVRWVLKAPLSAAGRERLFGGGHGAESPSAAQVERALRLHGRLLFEPWRERLADFGCSAWVCDDATVQLAVHAQGLDARGRPRGIHLRAGPIDRVWSVPPPGASEEELAAIGSAIEGVGDALRRRGYRGPFGIDSWRYRHSDGRIGWVSLGEVNVRMTMGLLARALVDRVKPPLSARPDGVVRFVFGRRCFEGRVEMSELCLPLLLAGVEDETEAYLAYEA